MRVTVDDRARRYTVSPDEPLLPGARPSAVAFATLVDECTQRPPERRVNVATTFPGLTARTVSPTVGLGGIPRAAFSALATHAYQVPFDVSGDRYVTVRRTAVLGPQPAFPATFVPTNLGTIDLHSDPVTIRGRVTTQAGVTITPAAGAAVRVTGIWRTVPEAILPPPSDPPNVVSLRPAVYFDRSAAVGLVRQREMVPVVGDARALLAPATAFAVTLRVSNRDGVVPGSILRVNSAPERSEFMTVLSVDGGSTADQPATVTLTYPLRHEHSPGTDVIRVTPQGPGADIALSVDATDGDACLLLTATAAIVPATVIELHGGPSPAEYHLVSRFETTTDAGGFFRLPPISRVAQLEIEVTDGVHAPLTHAVSPDYALPENRVDFMFV
jgi:hypothetical protein